MEIIKAQVRKMANFQMGLAMIHQQDLGDFCFITLAIAKGLVLIIHTKL